MIGKVEGIRAPILESIGYCKKDLDVLPEPDGSVGLYVGTEWIRAAQGS
jgi:hypothetical protein